MNRLSRYLFLLSLVFLISLGLFIGSIYLREAQKFQLNNASSLRLLTFTGFVVATAFLFGSALVALKKPFWGQKVLFVFERFIKQEWVHKSIFLLSVSTFVFITIPLWNIFIWGDARYQSILFRFSPIVFLLGSLSLIVIRTKYLKADRNKCVKLFLISSFCFGAGILLQSILMKKLELPLPISLRYQLVYFLTCLIFSITFIRQEKYDSFLLLILVALVVVLFVVEWFMFPNKLRRMLPGILLSAPIIILSLPLISLVLMNFWKWLRLNSRDWMKKVVYGLLTASLIILAITYYQAARIYSHEVNIDSTEVDQSAYLRFIKEARRLDFNYTGDHNRMPLYPYLQALFYHPDMNEQELFEQAKQFNLILSMILLVCLFLALLWLFGFFRSYLLILIIAFSLYIFKAPYVQAEILYYSLSALGFILMLVMLSRPTWLAAIATGIILGFAYLTKGTILSSLPLFVLLYGIDLLLFALKKYESRFNENLLFIARRAAYLLVVLVLFTLIIFPYIQALKQRFGHYFYNVNTTFYIWYNDWDVAKKKKQNINLQSNGLPIWQTINCPAEENI